MSAQRKEKRDFGDRGKNITSWHGGNEGLKSRDPSVYQISILEVAGTSGTTEDVQI